MPNSQSTSASPLSSEQIEDIRSRAIDHIATTTYKKTLARLDQSPEYQDKSDDEKKSLSYESLKLALDNSLGSIRPELISYPSLKNKLFADMSNIIITDGDSESDETDLDDDEI
jgi:hypothetical protein